MAYMLLLVYDRMFCLLLWASNGLCSTYAHCLHASWLVTAPHMGSITSQMTLCISSNMPASSFSQSIVQAEFPVLPGKSQSEESTDNDWGFHIH